MARVGKITVAVTPDFGFGRRAMVIRNYLVICGGGHDDVTILRVLHGHRNQRDLSDL
jgi:plasmid stabilization system protein ParE